MWSCQGQGYRFHDCRGLFAGLYSTDTGSCLKWSCCIKNGRVVLGQGWGLHKNSGSSAKAGHWMWPLAPYFWVHDLVIQAQAYSLEWSPVLWWRASTVWTHVRKVCLSDMKTLATESNSYVGAILGHPLGSQLQGGEWEHQVRRVTGSSKWVSVSKLLARWMLECVSECCLLLLSYQWYWLGLLGAGSWAITLMHIIFLNYNNTMRWVLKTKRKCVTGSEDLCFFILTPRASF